VVGEQDKYVHYVEKAVAESVDAEWALRFYNQLNKNRHSRLSFYTFNLGSPTGEGNGSYMEYGVSKNDETPIELGQWVFVLGEAEPWISPTDLSTGCALWKQGVEAKRETPDKYGDFGVHPQHGSGSITVGGSQETGLQGAIAHVAIWTPALGRRNRLHLERRRERPKQLRDVPQLRLSEWRPCDNRARHPRTFVTLVAIQLGIRVRPPQ
jgi:hypothetical protein